MADISNCPGIDCQDRETCYRYTAPDSEFRQSYLVQIGTGKDCGYYWDNEGRRNKEEKDAK